MGTHTHDCSQHLNHKQHKDPDHIKALIGTEPFRGEKPVCRSRSKLEPYMEQRTGSKLGKEYNKAVYCHSVYLTFLQSISYETLDWMSRKLKSRLPGEISTVSDIQMIPP